MHIDSVELFHVAVPLVKPWPSPGGPLAKLETVLVKIRSGELAGWGEASPGNGPWRSPEWAGGVFAAVRDWLAPALVGEEVISGKDLQERLTAFHRATYAVSALDTAWWDLAARGQSQPLHRLLGGTRNAVEIGATFDRMESIDDLLAAVGAAYEAGHARVKLKYRPGWDVQMVRVVRGEFFNQPMHIDCEGALTLDYLDTFYRLEDFRLAMIEQPVGADDLVGHAMLQAQLRTPVCLDESVTSLAEAQLALELQSAKYINVKPGKVGGLTPAVAIHNACREASVGCWVGATPQTGIGARIGAALAGLDSFNYPADFFRPDEYLAEDLAEPIALALSAEGNLCAALAEEPGLGVEPSAEWLGKYSVATAKVGS
ncbi:MAG: o-succinylbenzoate synthase [Pirellulales bacterium]